MITFNNIVAKFQAFCDDHFFIKTFSYGSPADVDLEKFEQYPLMHLVYTGGDYNTERTKTYNLEVYILTLPPSEADKNLHQKESISDAEQVAEDILADIQNGGDIFQFGYHYDLTSASVTPLEEENSNVLAGCLLDLSIAVPYTYDSCNAPLTGVEPEGSTPQSYRARGLLRVKEADGSPDVLSVATITVPNGSLTDDGDGAITLNFGVDSVVGESSIAWTNNTSDYTSLAPSFVKKDLTGPVDPTIVEAGGVLVTYAQFPTSKVLFSNVPENRAFTITATFTLVLAGPQELYNLFLLSEETDGVLADRSLYTTIGFGILYETQDVEVTHTFQSVSYTAYNLSFHADCFYGDLQVRLKNLTITLES